MRLRTLLAMTGVAVLLVACGGTRTLGSLGNNTDIDGPPPDIPKDLASVPDAVPKDEPLSRYGNPDSYEVLGRHYVVLDSSAGYQARGMASWYGRKFHGHSTSSGEPYNMYGMTAAHRTLPLPTYLRVTNLENGRQIVVRVNDRGPFHSDRIIDLSYTAAVRLDMIGNGTTPVEVVALPGGARSGKTTDNPALYLQAGAYSQAVNARKMVLRLETLGQAGVVIPPADGARGLYRVRLGPYADRANLEAARSNLRSNGIEVTALRN